LMTVILDLKACASLRTLLCLVRVISLVGVPYLVLIAAAKIRISSAPLVIE